MTEAGDAATLGSLLRGLREEQGLSPQEVEELLVLGPGWVAAWESGELDPTLPMLRTLVELYESTMQEFFASLTVAAAEAPRGLMGRATSDGVEITFPMGRHTARVLLPGVSEPAFLQVMQTLRQGLASGSKPSETVVRVYLDAVRNWPGANPSDVWYFFMSHAYQDPYNHPARDALKNWDQSWRRTGGWALETVVASHYNPRLREHGIQLRVLSTSSAEKTGLLALMGLAATAAEKLDVLAVGTDSRGRAHCFGALHVKASLAERRNDDESSSRELIGRGFLSSLVTMDCKATPSPTPVNRGEFGAVGTDDTEAINKRLEVENVRVFDAVFSFNQRTIPTPQGHAAAARIHRVTFNDPDDVLSQHIIDAWGRRTGRR